MHQGLNQINTQESLQLDLYAAHFCHFWKIGEAEVRDGGVKV
jgi:hypothetical protein